MTTYYVDGVDGSDSNAGTSEGSGNAWATIDKAMNTVAAGDKVWVKATGTYSETPVIDTAGTNWAAGNFIEFEGYTTTTGDGGKVTISGTTNCMTSSLGLLYNSFKNFIFTGASSSGVAMTNGDNGLWINCEFTSNGSHGIQCDNSHMFVNCIFANNGSRGADPDSGPIYIACKAYGNSSHQIYSSSGGGVFNCLIYETHTTTDATGLSFNYFIGNTVDGGGDNTAGVDMGASPNVVFNNIFHDMRSALEIAAQAQGYIGHNLLSNLSGYAYDDGGGTPVDMSGVGYVGYGDISPSDPGFTDEANNDYSLGAGSAAKGSGLEAP